MGICERPEEPIQSPASRERLMILGLLLALFSALVGPAVVLTMLLRRRRRLQRSRRSPLTADLLRPPAHSVRVKFEAVSEDVNEHALVLVSTPLVVYAAYVTAIVLSSNRSAPSPVLFIMATIAIAIWQGVQVRRLAVRLDRLRMGIDAETAVGQELDQLMREGAHVFHDVPADSFNVDHVVVCESGVFAIETKGRAKPRKGRGREDARVVFDGRVLQFPDWSETAPVEQARRQAAWVAQWLTAATGTTVGAQPILALPGWWIDQTGTSDVRVINGKRPQHLLSYARGKRLSTELVRRVAYQIEQKCRSVKPEFQRARTEAH